MNGGFRQDRSHQSAEVEETHQCFVCNQFGVPNFHSTSCDPTEQPSWEALAGSSLVPIKSRASHTTNNKTRKSSSSSKQAAAYGHIPKVLDPRSDRVRRWSRAVLLARILALAVDPFFFFALAVNGDGSGGGGPCIYIDGKVVWAVSVVRTCVDAMHLCHVWLQFRLAYVSKESLVVGCGRLVWDARDIAFHYLRSFRGFWLDAFVLLPIPQVFYLWMAPRLLSEEKTSMIMILVQLIFMLQYIPKVYHCYFLMHRMQLVTGYIFGSVWWRLGLSYMAYFLASHASGGYWFALAIQRVVGCLTKQCDASKKYSSPFLSCSNKANSRNSMCLDEDGDFPFGIYQFALPVISCDSLATKIFYSFLWGLTSFSTMGNILEPTSDVLEVILSIYMVIIGLILFTSLIGNIQVFLYALTGKATKNQVKFRDMEWWMRRRQLPSDLRRRVRHFENQRWNVMGGHDDMEMVKDLPEGLRRDIKRYLCLDLIKKAPFFSFLDDVILDNICDRVTYSIYSKGEKIIREGDPVQRMVFIVHGRVKRTQCLSCGMVATSTLEPGSFFGDELLSWCLRVPFINRYPAATATFTCAKATEAFALDANHLRYITNHFRYTFVNEKMKRRARYYSSNWRTWAAVNIQLAWRRYIVRTRGEAARNQSRKSTRLQHYAAMFMSLRPHDHLE
uniref:cyclic nucleotide-gated ion channel 2-like n=1 Tax=Erigeron canadensis TaxID=72917 RepID=UPI001CB8D187|nr:cyclic nucleotide-gated ion channel 2-like [Erigeron canadensis]